LDNIEEIIKEKQNEARENIKKGNYNRAIDIYLEILSKYKNSDLARETAYASLGYIYTDREKLDLAEDYIKKALNYSPLNAVYHRLLGTVYLMKKRLPEAIREFEISVKQEPENQECRAMLSLALAESDKSAEDIALQNETEGEYTEKAARLYISQAQASLAEGKLKKARKMAEKASLSDPSNTLAKNIIKAIQKKQLGETAAQAAGPTSPYLTYQLKIRLKEINPPIWRRFQVSGNISLYKLHLIMQSMMRWQNYHLFEFQIGEIRFGIPDPEDFYGTISARRHKLNKVIVKEKTKFLYRYDFGDGWEHEMMVEKIIPARQELKHPVCLDGERRGPPEDCGGPSGYEKFLEIWRTPPPADPEDEDEETRSSRIWLGEDFDPEHFDLEEINRHLRAIR
jgi:Tfp pilus assembly protein PilF